MKVLINSRYAYETDLEDIEIGDEMVLPGTMDPGPWTGIVTALEPTYDGPCRKALGLSRRRSRVDTEREALAQVRIDGWRLGERVTKACSKCGKDLPYLVNAVNNIGRPTSVRAESCGCGAPGQGRGVGSAESFRYFMIEAEA
jgi:hypothetical protein